MRERLITAFFIALALGWWVFVIWWFLPIILAWF
jgi:hypothetical protein